jgi:hypothetical protein
MLAGESGIAFTDVPKCIDRTAPVSLKRCQIDICFRDTSFTNKTQKQRGSDETDCAWSIGGRLLYFRGRDRIHGSAREWHSNRECGIYQLTC